MRTYSLDAKAAASAGVSQYVTDTGKYVGKFVRAQVSLSRENTEGVELDFVTEDGRSCNYISLWTHREDGSTLVSYKVLSAIMACLKMRELSPKPGQYKNKNGEMERGEGFPDLCGKPIGVLLQRENYTKNDGSPGYKFNIVAPFDPVTELTAGEILARKTEPEQLAKMVAMLKDRVSKPRAASGGGYQSGDPGYGSGADEDIPF